MIREREYNEFGEFLNDISEKKEGEYNHNKVFIHVINTKNEGIISTQIILTTLSMDNEKYCIIVDSYNVSEGDQTKIEEHYQRIKDQKEHYIERIKDKFSGKTQIIKGIERVKV